MNIACRITIVRVLAILLLIGVRAFAAAPSTTDIGRILCSYWREMPGAAVADLTANAAYPNYPDEQVYLDRFEIIENQEPNFGTAIRGFVHPPRDGDYTFYIAGNSQCELWLSDNAEPAGKKLIASVPDWSLPRDFSASPQQQSKPIHLNSHTTYYIEALHKNGGGDNHLFVSWKLPDGTLEAPISGSHLSPAPPVVVPEPKVTLSAMPATPGANRLTATVVSPMHTSIVPILLTLPRNYDAAHKYPLLVFLPDTDEEPDADGYRIQGPDRPLPAIAAIRAASPFITITPQCPTGRVYDQRSTIKAISAAITELANRYPIDRDRIALTGANSGATAAWRMVLAKPGFCSALSAICGRQVIDKQLTPALHGTRVLIYTDIAKGFVTECANRIQESLAGLEPPSKVIYLGEKELGTGTAADYCYAQPSFYDSLLAGPAAAPRHIAQPSASRYLASILFAALVITTIITVALWLRRRRSR